QVAIYAHLNGGSATEGIFAGTPGALQVAALQGTAAPAGGTYAHVGYGPVLNSGGQVAFVSQLNVGATGIGVFAGAPGSVQAVARSGTAAPAGGNYSYFPAGPALNAAGQVAFLANMIGGTTTGGLFVGAPGAVQAAALLGSAAPAGGAYSSFGGFSLNASEKVAFYANLSGGSATSGIFVGTPGTVQAAAL